MPNTTLLFLILATPLAAEVTIEPLSGPARSGSLVEMDERRVVIEEAGKRVSFPTRELLTVTTHDGDRRESDKTRVWVELVDGSRIEAAQYTVADRVASLTLTDRTVRIETRNIRSVRFHPSAPDLDAQWEEILGGRHTGDVVVLRRSSKSLDQLEGVFRNVDPDVVEFEFDDELIPVRREKLEGLLYFQPVARDLPDAICLVDEAGGSRWRVKSWEWRDGVLEFVTTGGTRCELPWSELRRLDFSAGNVVYLSDLPFESVEITPFFGSRLSPERIAQLYEPRRDSGYEGSGLWIGEGNEQQVFEKGLSLRSRTVLTFRLAEPYRQFTAVAGIDSRLRGRGHVILIISGDDRELLRQAISGQEAPVPIELDLEGVRRLKITVDFGDALDIADHLNLCNARIIK